MQTFEFESSSSDAKYTTIITDDGRIGCNCRGWTIRKGDKPRECKHTKKVVADNGLLTEARGEYVFVTTKVAAVAVPKAPPPPVTIAKGEGYVEPMLASPAPDDFSTSAIADFYPPAQWAMEEKFDGHRVLVVVNKDDKAQFGATVEAWSRPRAGKEPLRRTLPPHIAEVFQTFPHGTYDGELMIRGGQSHDVVNLANAGKEVFVIFDIPRLLGDSGVGRQSYDQRREYMERIANARNLESGPVLLAKSWKPSAAKVKEIWARGGEGVILKRRSAPYQPGKRSQDFVKVKKLLSAVCVVIGYEAGECGPFSKTLVRDKQGRFETSVKWKNNAYLRDLEKNGTRYAKEGREIRIEFNDFLPSGKPRHPRIDRYEDE